MSKYDFDRKEWMNPDTLEFTNDYESAMYQKHLFPYNYIKNELTNLNVLEIGCGAGYGLEVIHSDCISITTVDIDPESLAYAKAHHAYDNVSFVEADITKGLPFEDHSFDQVISFQVIEHFTKKDVHKYLAELSRLLKPGGKVLFTTPNRETRLLPYQRPVNNYHPIEYSSRTLAKLLKRHFKDVTVLGLRSTEEIEQLFNSRKRQSYLRAFIIKPSRDFIYSTSKRIGLKAVTSLLDQRSKYSRPKKKITQKEVQPNDFQVESSNIRKSIDLFARCTK